jgi:ABC-2 type transport system permease protein
VPSFLVQLRFELLKLARRRRTWLGVGAAVSWQLLCASLLRLPAVRARIAEHFHQAGLTFTESFSGLTCAAYVLASTMTIIGALFIALVAADLVAQEREEGTLRMVFARPVKRRRIFAMKVSIALAYAVAFTWFCGACALTIGLIAEGPGRLVMVGYKESVFGVFDWREGLWRYALAVALDSISLCTVALLAFAFSCARMKPATATALALTVCIADDAIRNLPAMQSVRHQFLMTRVVAWVGAYNDPLQTARIRRAYVELAVFDVGFIGAAWLVFRRSEFKP